MKWAGVIGTPVDHSLSPVIHQAAWRQLGLPEDWEYRRLDVSSRGLEQVVAGLDVRCLGLSVTMPLKYEAAECVDVLDPLAQAVGAVNTLIPTAGVVVGFNTDVHGIMQALAAPNLDGFSIHEGGSPRGVILGSGATAASALNALWSLGISSISVVARRFSGPHSIVRAAHRMGIECEQVMLSDSRTIERRIAEATCVVSTLPSGVADFFVLPEALGTDQTLLDVVYAPWETPLMSRWRDRGGRCVHGSEMLLHQGAMQVKLMTGREPDVSHMRQVLMEFRQGGH